MHPDTVMRDVEGIAPRVELLANSAKTNSLFQQLYHLEVLGYPDHNPRS